MTKIDLKPDALTRAMDKCGRDRTRELARQRDKRTCQMCKKQWQVGQRRFDIHHLVGCGFKSMHYDRVEDLDNLITYCHRCHLNLHSVTKKMATKSGQQKLNSKTKRSSFYNR